MKPCAFKRYGSTAFDVYSPTVAFASTPSRVKAARRDIVSVMPEREAGGGGGRGDGSGGNGGGEGGSGGGGTG